jgi:hypothetical protein
MSAEPKFANPVSAERVASAAINVDCAVQFDNTDSGGGAELTLFIYTGLVEAIGSTYTVSSDTPGTFAASDVGDMFYIQPLQEELSGVDNYGNGVGRLTVTAYTDSQNIIARLDAGVGIQHITTNWCWARAKYTHQLFTDHAGDGFHAFDALQDGYFTTGAFDGTHDVPPYVDTDRVTASAGSLTLPAHSLLATVGFRYFSEFGTLDFTSGMGKQKIVKAVDLRVVRPLKDWWLLSANGDEGIGDQAANEEPDNGVTNKPADGETGNGGPNWVKDGGTGFLGASGGMEQHVQRFEVPAEWAKEGRAFLRTYHPTPLIIMGIKRETEVAD